MNKKIELERRRAEELEKIRKSHEGKLESIQRMNQNRA